jgi:ATP-binding cassette subfamily B protein
MSDQYFEEEEFTTQFNGKTALRILSLTRPHWKWVVAFLASIALVSFLDAYFTYLSKRLVDEGIVAANREMVFRIIAIYGSLILVQAAAVFGFIYMVGTLGERIRYDLRQRMFNHLQQLSLAYFNQTPVGWIMARVTSDSDRVADLITWGLLDTSWGLMNIVSSTFFMMVINGGWH